MTTIFKPVRRLRGFKYVYTLEVIVDGLFADNFGTYRTLEEAKAEGTRLEEEHRRAPPGDSF